MRIKFDNIDEWLYADELTGLWLTLAGGGTSQQQATTTRYSELHIWGPSGTPVILRASQLNNANWSTSVLTLAMDHPYFAPAVSGGTAGTYMDESVPQSILMMQVVDGGAAGNLYLFMPALIAQSWGRTGPGHVSKVQRDASRIFFNRTLDELLPCAGTTVFCDRIHDGAYQVYLDAWLGQAGEGMKLVDGINQARTEHHHTFGIRVANITGLTFIDARSSLSLLSTTNNTNNRKATVASARLRC